MFPALGPEIKAVRHPGGVSSQFALSARERGFEMSFHDIRAAHQTALLDRGVPVHVVADRCGHDPAVLLKRYARRIVRNGPAGDGGILGGVKSDNEGSDVVRANLVTKNAGTARKRREK